MSQFAIQFGSRFQDRRDDLGSKFSDNAAAAIVAWRAPSPSAPLCGFGGAAKHTGRHAADASRSTYQNGNSPTEPSYTHFKETRIVRSAYYENDTSLDFCTRNSLFAEYRANSKI
jgi:hypothetical protein